MAVPRTFDEKMEILDHCMQLEKTGGDILGYLWSKDYITPRATWFNYQRIYLKRRPYEVTDGKPKEKGENDAMKMLTDEERAEAMRIAMDGGNPRDYLGQIGCKNPTTSWKSILQYYRKHSPGVVEMLPSKLQGKAETPEMPTVKLDGPLTIETPEASQAQVTESSITISKDKIVAAVSKPKITKPVMYDGLEVSAVRDHDLGEFYYDHDHNCIDWRNPFGDEVSLGVAGWKTMAQRLTKILNVLGVDA